MGQSPSQVALTDANGEPERRLLRTARAGQGLRLTALALHKSTENIARISHPHTGITTTTKNAAQRKEAKLKNDDSSETDEDDESDWSDWNAKANKGLKQRSAPHDNTGPSTYETTSGAEGEDDSDREGQMSIAENIPTARKGSNELELIGLPVHSPTNTEGDAEEKMGDKNVQIPAAKSASGNGDIIASDGKLHSLETSDSDASVAVGEAAENVYEERVGLPKPPKPQPAPAEQPLSTEKASERNSAGSRQLTAHDRNMVPARVMTSDQETSSSSSIFDFVPDSALVTNNVVQKATLKRKRRSADERLVGPRRQLVRKRRKRSIFSPPTSVPSEDEEVSTAASPSLRAILGRFRINRLAIQPKPTFDQGGHDQESVAAWVKPLSFSPSLKHPLFNSSLKQPLRSRESKRVGRKGKPSALSSSAVPRRPARKSSPEIDKITATMEDSSNNESKVVNKRSRGVLSSPKGKSKAKPGVEYSSTSSLKSRAKRVNSNEKSGGMRRSKVPNSYANNSSSEDEFEQQNPDRSESSSIVSLSEIDTEKLMRDSSVQMVLICKTCNQKFKRVKELQTHKRNNRTHAKLYKCSKCREEFDDMTLLLHHQSQEKHPREMFHSRNTGPFSEVEKQKLAHFMMDYCDEHGIDESVFRQMMTDSSRRGLGTKWPWPWVTRLAFLNEYYDVLPGRAHKSMQRYKERYFQNLDHNKEWTKKDDKQLVDLVNELGPKWIEIGIRLNRTQDSVTQRYKKKLKDGDTTQSGPWSSREHNALAKVIGEIKDELGLLDTTKTDKNIPWFEVSRRMGGTRTAQQCSAHWRQTMGHKPKVRGQSAKGVKKVKSKEFVSSDSDENLGYVNNNHRRESIVAVDIPKQPSDAATRARRSPELGSSDYNEQNIISFSIESHSGAFAQVAKQEDNPIEPVMATADEWARILEAEEQSSDAPAAVDMEDNVPDVQGIQIHQKVDVGEKPPVIYTSEKKSRGANYKASRNPFTKDTPVSIMNLSQAFNETQAPTSVLRQPMPNGLEVPAPNSSRPSPDIGLRLRPDSSQDLGRSERHHVRPESGPMADGYEKDCDIEIEDLGSSGDENGNYTDLEYVKEVESGTERPIMAPTASDESESEYSELGDEPNPSRSASISPAVNDGENALVDGNTEENEEDDAGRGNDESEEDYDSGQEADKSQYENENSIDSMVKDTHNDFMANIKESAKYISQRTPMLSRKIIEESDDDSS